MGLFIFMMQKYRVSNSFTIAMMRYFLYPVYGIKNQDLLIKQNILSFERRFVQVYIRLKKVNSSKVHLLRQIIYLAVGIKE